MAERDVLRRFLFETHHVRGELVHLNASYQSVLTRHAYPSPLQRLLGQALAASALLAATLKFEGCLSLQYHAQSAIKLLLAKCTHDLHLRGLAHYADDALDNDFALTEGQLMIAIEQQAPATRYQGVVACHGQRLSNALEQYFMQSEQLPTRLWLAANGQRACGLLLQQIPVEGEANPEAWQNIVTLTETMTTDELMLDDSEDLLAKLYHEHAVRLFDPDVVSFRCPCSLSRMEQALKTMPLADIHAILSTHKQVDVNCEFCNAHYAFDPVDVERIFKQGLSGDSAAH